MTYTITLTEEEETSLKHLLAWNLEDATMLDPNNQARKRIYEKLLKSEYQGYSHKETPDTTKA